MDLDPWRDYMKRLYDNQRIPKEYMGGVSRNPGTLLLVSKFRSAR